MRLSTRHTRSRTELRLPRCLINSLSLIQVVPAGALSSISTAAQLATIKRLSTTSTPNHQLLKLWGMDSQICTKTGMTSSLSSSGEATSSTQSLSGVTDTPVTHRAILVITNMVLVDNLT